jgi:hypothetical protein
MNGSNNKGDCRTCDFRWSKDARGTGRPFNGRSQEQVVLLEEVLHQSAQHMQMNQNYA